MGKTESESRQLNNSFNFVDSDTFLYSIDSGSGIQVRKLESKAFPLTPANQSFLKEIGEKI